MKSNCLITIQNIITKVVAMDMYFKPSRSLCFDLLNNINTTQIVKHERQRARMHDNRNFKNISLPRSFFCVLPTRPNSLRLGHRFFQHLFYCNNQANPCFKLILIVPGAIVNSQNIMNLVQTELRQETTSPEISGVHIINPHS